MPGFEKSIRLRGLHEHPNIILSSKTSLRSFARALSTGRNLSILNKCATALPAHNGKSTAAFPTHSQGLRKLLYLDDPWSPEMKALDPHKARIAFLKTNPFNDAAAHNCCLRFKGVARHEDDYTDGKTVRGWFDREIGILQDELKKLVRLAKEADNTVNTNALQEKWPTVIMFNELSSLWPTGMFEIVFKVPGRSNPQSFFWRLRDLNLESGEFVTAEGGSSQGVDRWWHRFLYCLPEEQKYWLPGSGAAQVASSAGDHRAHISSRQPTTRNRYGLGRRPVTIIKNRAYTTTTLGLRCKRPGLSSPLAHDKRIGAPFSTHSHGLRKVLWTDLVESELRDVDPAVALHDFKDPKAHHCVLWFWNRPGVPSPKDKTEETPNVVMALFAKETGIVQKELNKIINPADEDSEWPVILDCPKYSTSHPNYRDVNIAFRVPSSVDHSEFHARLRKAGLKRAQFGVSFGGEELWYRRFYSMPDDQKYWLHRKKTQAATPGGEQEPTTAARQGHPPDQGEIGTFSTATRQHSDWKEKSTNIGRRSYATASKDHSTKSTLVIEYRTIPVEEEEAAAATWDTINPFNEPLARNCALIIENAPLIRDEDGKLEHSATHRQFDEQSGLVLEEMGKVLKAAGNKAHWPTLGKLQDARVPHQNLPYDFHIYFRIPASEELEAFEARLRTAGLESGYLKDLGREFDKWWHATLWGMAKGGFSIPADMNNE